MRKKRVRGHRSGAVLRRTAALFMAGSAVWLLWLTVDLRPAGQALRGLGEDTELAATLLAAELGKPARDGPLTGMTGWERFGGNPILSGGAAGEWDAEAVYKPWLEYLDGQWLLWANGRRAAIEQVGLYIYDGDDLGLENWF